MTRPTSPCRACSPPAPSCSRPRPSCRGRRPRRAMVRASADSTTVAARFSEGSRSRRRRPLRRPATRGHRPRRVAPRLDRDHGRRAEPVVAGRPDGPTYAMPARLSGAPSRAGRRHRPARRAIGRTRPRTLERIGHYLAVTAEAIRVERRPPGCAAGAPERVRSKSVAASVSTSTTASARRWPASASDCWSPMRRLPAELSVDDIVDQISDTIREVRRIVEGLQPSVLEDLGLVPALQILVADTRQASGIDVTIAADPELLRHPGAHRRDQLPGDRRGSGQRGPPQQRASCTVAPRPSRPAPDRHPGRRLRIRPALRDGNGPALDRHPSERRGRRVSITSTAGVGTTIAVSLPA